MKIYLLISISINGRCLIYVWCGLDLSTRLNLPFTTDGCEYWKRDKGRVILQQSTAFTRTWGFVCASSKPSSPHTWWKASDFTDSCCFCGQPSDQSYGYIRYSRSLWNILQRDQWNRKRFCSSNPTHKHTHKKVLILSLLISTGKVRNFEEQYQIYRSTTTMMSQTESSLRPLLELLTIQHTAPSLENIMTVFAQIYGAESG